MRGLQAEMVELRQVMVANNFKMPAPRISEGSSEVRLIQREILPWDGSKGNQAHSYYIEARAKVAAYLWCKIDEGYLRAKSLLAWTFAKPLTPNKARKEGDL